MQENPILTYLESRTAGAFAIIRLDFCVAQGSDKATLHTNSKTLREVSTG